MSVVFAPAVAGNHIALYDGTNGAAIAAAGIGITVISGGSGNAPMVWDNDESVRYTTQPGDGVLAMGAVDEGLRAIRSVPAAELAVYYRRVQPAERMIIRQSAKAVPGITLITATATVDVPVSGMPDADFDAQVSLVGAMASLSIDSVAIQSATIVRVVVRTTAVAYVAGASLVVLATRL